MADFDFMASVVGAATGLAAPGVLLLGISQSGAFLARLLPKKKILTPEDLTPELEAVKQKDARLPLTESLPGVSTTAVQRSVDLDPETRKLLARVATNLVAAERTAVQNKDEAQEREIRLLRDRLLDNVEGLKESVAGEGFKNSNLILFLENLKLISQSLDRATAHNKKAGNTRLRVLQSYLEEKTKTNAKSIA